jgi:DNA-binding MarR family transcriptional regulator
MNRSTRWIWTDELRTRARSHTISASAHHVGVTLALYYINGSSEAWPSQHELAASSGESLRTVQRAITELEQAGLLTSRRGHPAHTSGYVYHLRITPL